MKRQDTKGIKYILDEMDPSERVEFERAIRDDSDLLIEVESFKRVHNKLSKLPEFEPPKSLTNAILAKATQRSSEQSGKQFKYWVSAAAIVFGLSASALLVENPFQTDGEASQASVNIPSSVHETQQNRQEKAGSQPWVDRNNVLHFSDFESNSLRSQNFEFRNSLKKLKPAERSGSNSFYNHQLQLTGSN